MRQLRESAVMAGVLVGAGFFIVRTSMARGAADYVLAVGIGMCEVAPVLALERKARQLAPKIDQWRADAHAQNIADALIVEARDEQGRRLELLNDVKGKITQIEEDHLKGRVWGSQLETNKGLAVSSMRSGYVEQVALNRIAGILPGEQS